MFTLTTVSVVDPIGQN